MASPFIWKSSSFAKLLAALGFETKDGRQLIFGTGNPSTGAGYAAPQGSVLINELGVVYYKTNTTDTDWTQSAVIPVNLATDITGTLGTANGGTGATGFTASKVIQSDASGNLQVSGVTSTELGYLSGVTSALQTQLNNKVNTSSVGAANGVAGLNASGYVPLANMDPSVIERMVVVANQAARFALTTATVQNGDTVLQNDTQTMYYVIDQTNLGNASGYNVYSAGTSVNFTGALSGEVTGTQTTTVVGNAAVIAKVLTGFTSGAGILSASDSILQAIQKLDGNVAAKEPAFTTLPISKGGTGQSTQAAAITALTGTQTSGKYLRSDGTNAALDTLKTLDLPTITLTGDVTATGAGGGLATTIPANTVTNAKAAQMAANTIKGNNLGATANASDLTVAQVNTMLGNILFNWTALTTYTSGSLVQYTNNIYRCITGHTASASFEADVVLGYWVIVNADAVSENLAMTGSNFETGTSSGWTGTGIATLTNGLPTTVGTAGTAFSSTNGGRALGANTSAPSTVAGNPINNVYALNLATTGAGTAGDGYVSKVYNVAPKYRAKSLTVSLSYLVATAPTGLNLSGTSSNTYALAVYDVTNAVWIGMAGNFNFVQSSGVGTYSGTFQTGSNTAAIQIFLYSPVAPGSASSFLIDDVWIGMKPIARGPAIKDWTSYTPTVGAGFGTATNIAFFYRQDGDMLSIQGTFTVGTVAASLATLTLPSGLSIDSSKISINNTSANPGTMVGYYDNSEALANTQGCIVTAPATSTTLVYFGPGETNASSSLTPANGNVVTASSVVMSVNFSVPIAGWSSNSVMSSDADTRVVSFVKQNINTSTAYANSTISDLTWLSTATINDTHSGWDGTYYNIPVTGYYTLSTYFVLNSLAYPAGAQYDVFWADSSNTNIYDIGEFTGAASTGRVSGGKNVGPFLFNAGQKIKPRFFHALNAAGASFQQITIGINKLAGPAIINSSESVIAEYSDSAGATFAATTVANALTFNTKETDTHSFFNGATGVATAPVSGRYLFVGSIGVYTSGAAPANSYADVILTSSTGVTKTCRQQLLGTSNIQEIPFMKMFTLQAGQTVTLTKQATYSSGTVTMFAGAAFNTISIIKVGN